LQDAQEEKMTSMETFAIQRSVARFLRYAILVVYAVTTIAPFVWLLLTSMKGATEVYVNSFGLPRTWKFINYLTAWSKARVRVYFGNSLLYAFSSLFLCLLFAGMVSYVLTRVWRSLAVFSYFMIGIMIPIQALLIPTFMLMKNIGLLNTRIGLMALYVAANLSLSIFIISGFMKGVPMELEDAAFVDGCSRSRFFFTIMVPLSKGGFATAGVLTFLNCWNDFVFAYIFISPMNLKTISQGVMILKGEYITDFGLLSAGLVISIIPVFIMYVLFQEQVVSGLTAGAIKG
jgi:raffinose/stachyose/melibiose transport system permease protein